MSQTNTTEDAGVPTRTADRLRAGIGVLKRGLIEMWLVAFAVVSVVGYGVRDGFQRRPAVGVIYTATVALGLFGAVVGVGRLFDVSLIGPVGVGVAGGIVVGSTACSLVLDDTADRDYRHQVASRLPVDTGGSTNARASAGASPTAAETEEPAEPPADGDGPGSPRDESDSDGREDDGREDDGRDDGGRENGGGREDREDPRPDHERGTDGAQGSDGMSGQYVTKPPDLDFDDVAGFDDLKRELHERVIDPLEEPEKYERYGLSVENGFLLHGPPGTGKTYLSKALAGELDINYVGVKGSDIISKWLGEGTQNVAELFEEARDNQPCLIFIDEIDALTPERTTGNQHQDQTQMVNQFLEEISDINESDADIVIIGATNRRDRIDNAMLRSGRLSVQVEVEKPGPKTRAAIFDVHLDAPRDSGLDPKWIADQSKGLTAADMEQVANEAARSAMRREGKVTNDDIAAAIKEVRN
ncbi:MAG: ATPase of the AAA+ class [Halonotius sp. J07HN6]|nr:MAG: ATPase of the AAA+ class [Halonotius sp. J07HN6]ERH05396.1 MAG: ATPase of the AAA+ class [Halonotius sp. J07HN4]